ncbi:hypothetical protein SUGI_0220660 [Cryptomeria japonica]|uniref:probable CCR4-associated factor 1 homolog 6 n=1 Tax=Cryptomeria japonica TaxID=3369 RepID=UPI0024089EDA|nr:probable CCR4-associated factor 1 homolog 6 [Cryptomeria japonica]GLJ13820.1 hypothetical protein SUGI_0220660 [Cryptomeria japonica]
MAEFQKRDSVFIKEVWAYNVEEEIEAIRSVVKEYPYVAMDTEFPGTVVKPTLKFRSKKDYQYSNMMVNVNLLSLIQLGLTFFDKDGNLPDCGTGQPCAWQFNFREFDPAVEIHDPESISLLTQSGIDFKKNNAIGIDAKGFARMLTLSGIFFNENVHWIAFHGVYDFGYMLKLLTCSPLPPSGDQFFELMKFYFPSIYDVKYLIKYCDGLYGGLNRLAELLNVQRVGIAHQAGSDSLLTCSVFMKLKQGFPETYMDRFANVVYGLG